MVDDNALPVPGSTPGTAVPAQISGPALVRMFTLLASYLLYERREETVLQQAFITLVRERHLEFHIKGRKEDADPEGWLKCGNQVCIGARHIIEEGRAPEVVITPMAAEVVNGYRISLTPRGDALHAVLVEHEAEGSKIIQPTAADMAAIQRAQKASRERGAGITINNT